MDDRDYIALNKSIEMSTEIQIEHIIDIINKNYRLHTGINESILHAAEDIIELFNCKKIDKIEQSVVHSAESHLTMHPDLEHIKLPELIESVEQAKKEWEKEKEVLKDNINHLTTVIHYNA